MITRDNSWHSKVTIRIGEYHLTHQPSQSHYHVTEQHELKLTVHITLHTAGISMRRESRRVICSKVECGWFCKEIEPGFCRLPNNGKFRGREGPLPGQQLQLQSTNSHVTDGPSHYTQPLPNISLYNYYCKAHLECTC